MLLRTSGADSKLRDKNHLRFSVGAFLPIVGEASSSSNVLPWCISVLLGKRGGGFGGVGWEDESPAGDQGLAVGPSGPVQDLAKCLRHLKSEEEWRSLSPIVSEQLFNGCELRARSKLYRRMLVSKPGRLLVSCQHLGRRSSSEEGAAQSKAREPGVRPRVAVSRGIAGTGRHEESRVKLAELPGCPEEWDVRGGQGHGQCWGRISLAWL